MDFKQNTKVFNAKILITLLIIGLITACASQITDTPVSTATEKLAAPTQTATSLPAATNTAFPTDTAQATLESTAKPAPQGSTGVSFANDIFPILQSRCINCHGGDRTEEGLVMLTHAELMAGSDNGPVVVAGDAENSLLLELVSTQKMPKRGPKLTPPQVQVIIDWIDQGALDN